MPEDEAAFGSIAASNLGTVFARQPQRHAKPARDARRIINYCKTTIKPLETSLPRAASTGYCGDKESLWRAKATSSFTSHRTCAPQLSTRASCACYQVSLRYTRSILRRATPHISTTFSINICTPSKAFTATPQPSNIASRDSTSHILSMAPMTSEPAHARARRRKYIMSKGKVTST